MGTIVVGAIFNFLQSVANGVVWLLAHVLAGISDGALAIAKQTWVDHATQVSVAVASGLFSVRLAWEALSRYILWNEGNSDTDGGQALKGILRVAIYGAAGTTLVYKVFQFGIWYGAALMAAPLADATTNAGNVLPHLLALPGMAMDDILVCVMAFLVLLVCLIVVTIQMSIRGAELVFFTVAAPVVALGQFSADGGIWGSWWRSLVVLSMSQAVQWLGIKGVVASMAVITNTGSPTTKAILSGLSLLTPGTLAAFGLVLSIGFAVATIRGPHLLKEWSYRTGIGASIVQGAVFGGQTIGRQWIMSKLGK